MTLDDINFNKTRNLTVDQVTNLDMNVSLNQD